MKLSIPGLLVALTCFCFASSANTSAFAARPLIQSESEDDSKNDDKAGAEVIQKVLKKVAAAEKKKKYSQLRDLMTDSAWDKFVASKIMEATMMASPQMGGNEKILDVLDEFGIDSEPPEMEFEIDMDELQADLLKGIEDDERRIKLLKKLDKAKSAPAGMGGGMVQMIEISIFEGEIVGSSNKGDVAKLQLKPSMPELPDGVMMMAEGDLPEGVEIEDMGPDGPDGDFEVMGGGGMPEFPAITLKFRKAGDSWKFDGTEMEDLEFSQEHPTIEDPKLTGKTIDGKEIKLEDLRGKLVLLDFWGTWCKGCIAEFPKLKKLAKTLEGKDFVLVGIAQDSKEDLEKFLAKNPLPWANVIDSGTICSKFKVNVFPTTMLIDQKGNHVASNLSPKALIKEIAERLELDDSELETLMEALKQKKKRLKNSAAF